MALRDFITRHFGGIPRSLKDLEWIYRVATEYRVVAPGSRPAYVAPVNDKISNIQYFKRDVRRAYPQTVVFSQQDLVAALPSPSTKSISAGESAVAATTAVPASSSGMPPIINNRYQYKPSAPHLNPEGDSSNPEFCIRAVQ
eukprot:jgi/Hompol1/4470/HPOL_001729-RA